MISRLLLSGKMVVRKDWVFFLLAGLIVLAIPSSATAAATAAPAAKAKPGLPRIISMATAAPGGANYAWAAGLADIVTNNTPMKLLIESYPGPGAVFPLMEKASIDLAGWSTPEHYWAFYGDHAYREPTGGKGYKGLRSLFMDAVYTVGLVTGADTGIKTTRELKGKRIALPASVMLTAHLNVKAYVANGGWTEKDVVYVPVGSPMEGKKLNVEKKVDASTHPLGTGDVEEIAAARGGARFISLDPSPEARKRGQEFIPSIPQLIKKGTATGVPEDTWLNTHRSQVISWETLPDDAAYAIVEAVWNNMEKYRNVHVLLRSLTQKRLATIEATVPFHPGAVKFYKEKGLWTDELENHQKALLEGKR